MTATPALSPCCAAAVEPDLVPVRVAPAPAPVRLDIIHLCSACGEVLVARVTWERVERRVEGAAR